MDFGVMPQLFDKKCRQAGGIFLLILKKKKTVLHPQKAFQKQLRNSKIHAQKKKLKSNFAYQ